MLFKYCSNNALNVIVESKSNVLLEQTHLLSVCLCSWHFFFKTFLCTYEVNPFKWYWFCSQLVMPYPDTVSFCIIREVRSPFFKYIYIQCIYMYMSHHYVNWHIGVEVFWRWAGEKKTKDYRDWKLKGLDVFCINGPLVIVEWNGIFKCVHGNYCSLILILVEQIGLVFVMTIENVLLVKIHSMVFVCYSVFNEWKASQQRLDMGLVFRFFNCFKDWGWFAYIVWCLCVSNSWYSILVNEEQAMLFCSLSIQKNWLLSKKNCKMQRM